MKLHLPKEDWNSKVPPPTIYYKSKLTIGMTPTDNVGSIKIDINTQIGERDSRTVAIYLPLFQKGSTEAFLKFVTILNNIIWGQDLSTVPQKFGTKRNLVVREALWIFDQKAWERETETNANYELVMKDRIYHFCPPKALQLQKRYLRRGLYKTCNTKIWDLICRINDMVK